MDIEEIKNRKKKLESEISSLLMAFAEETGVTPQSIDLTFHTLGYANLTLTLLKIKLSI